MARAKHTSRQPPRRPAGATKRVYCTHCDGALDVAPRAISGVCPHCNKRLEIEDVRIERYYAVRKLATCGDVLIDRRGHVVAAVHAANLTIKGKLKGNVRVRGRVRIGKTALVSGDIEALLLRVENGAELCGHLRIGDQQPPSVP